MREDPAEHYENQLVELFRLLSIFFSTAPDPTVDFQIPTTPNPISGQNITIGKNSMLYTFLKKCSSIVTYRITIG